MATIAGGVLAAVLKISNVDCMVIANDATVKAGAYFEVSLKKTLKMLVMITKKMVEVVWSIGAIAMHLQIFKIKRICFGKRQKQTLMQRLRPPKA